MPRFVAGVLMAVLLLAMPGLVRAESAVSMNITAGFDGKGKPGRWVPVDVELVNNGPDLQGDLIYDQTPPFFRQQSVTRYQTAISLPGGSHKHYRLYMLMGQGPNGLSVPRIDAVSGGKVVASAQPQVALSTDLLVGVLGPETATLARIGSVPFPIASRSLSLVHLDPQTFPDQGQALDGLDVILVDNFAASSLTPEQQKAIISWTEQGGVLMLAGGPEARKTVEPFAGWLNLELDSQRSLDGSGLAGFAGVPLGGSLAVAPARLAGAHTVLADAGTPLIQEVSRGSGRVIYLAFDPSLEPLTRWDGISTVWSKLLLRNIPADRLNAFQNQNSWEQALQNATSNLPVANLPSVRWFILLMVAYILLLGPVNFLVLRRMRRAHLAWVTVPALVLLFSSTAWAMARRSGQDVLVNRITLLQLQPGNTLATQRTAAAIFTPAEMPVGVQVEQGGLLQVFPANGSYMIGGGQVGSAADLPAAAAVRIDGGRVDLKPVGIYSQRVIFSQGTVTVTGTVDGALSFGAGGHLTGKLTNHTSLDMKDVAVVTSAGFQSIGSLPAGGSADVDVTLNVAPACCGPNPLFNVLQRLYQQQPGNGIAAVREMQRRMSMANAAVELLPPQELGVYVFGWADKAVSRLTVNGHDASARATTLVVQPLPASAGPQAFDVPPGLVSGRVVEWDGKNPMNYGNRLLPLPAGGSVTLEFALPVQPGRPVTALDLRLDFFKGQPAGVQNQYNVLLRDRVKGTWEQVTLKNQDAAIADAARFVSADGQVLVRLSSSAPNQSPINPPTLGFAGAGVQ